MPKAKNKTTGVIYGLYDPRDGQLKYIGKTVDLKNRIANHLIPSVLKVNTKKNNWLKKIKELGLRPIVKILKECAFVELNYWEKEFIKKYKPIKNDTPGGDGWPVGRKQSSFTIKKLVKSTSKAVIARHKETEKELNFTSIASAARKLKTNQEQLHWCLRGNGLSCKSYYWRYANEEFVEPRKKKTYRTIVGTNLETGEKLLFEKIDDVKSLGFSPKCVQGVCSKEERKAHRGYSWEYLNE